MAVERVNRAQSARPFSFLLDQSSEGRFRMQHMLPPASLAEALNPTRRGTTQEFVGRLRERPDQARMYHLAYSMLGVKSIAQIHELSQDPAEIKKRGDVLYRRLAADYGLYVNEDPRSLEQVKYIFNGYGKQANEIVRIVRDETLSYDVPLGEMTNEVESQNNPFKLLLMAFTEPDARSRFEAVRKLVLIDAIAQVEQRNREQGFDDQLADFHAVLRDAGVWRDMGKDGKTLPAIYLHSRHNAEDGSFAVLSTEEVSKARGDSMRASLPTNEKLTPLIRREFTYTDEAGQLHTSSVYITLRTKLTPAAVIKWIRKDESSVETALDKDDVGIMIIAQSNEDILHFEDHMLQSLGAAGYNPRWPSDKSKTVDNLNGGAYPSNSNGSSTKLRQRKFEMQYGKPGEEARSIEVIEHTYDSYADYLYHAEMGHDVFAAKRLFDAGVVELFFPQNIYPGLDYEALRAERIKVIDVKSEGPDYVEQEQPL